MHTRITNDIIYYSKIYYDDIQIINKVYLDHNSNTLNQCTKHTTATGIWLYKKQLKCMNYWLPLLLITNMIHPIYIPIILLTWTTCIAQKLRLCGGWGKSRGKVRYWVAPLHTIWYRNTIRIKHACMYTRFHIQTCCRIGSFIEVADVKEILAYSRSRHVEPEIIHTTYP